MKITGLTAIKIKVGPDSEKDLRRVAAVREAIGSKALMKPKAAVQ
jgi:L-alanine-DL-glutamate epimerase-like enolase superfamily enzyme